MLRSLRVLLLTILVSLSLPALRCDAQPAIAPANSEQLGGPSPRMKEIGRAHV